MAGTHKGKRGVIGETQGTGRNTGKVEVAQVGHRNESYWVYPNWVEVEESSSLTSEPEPESVTDALNCVRTTEPESQANTLNCQDSGSSSAYRTLDPQPNPWKSPAEFTVTLKSGLTVFVKFVPRKEEKLQMHQFDFRGSISPTGFQSHFVLAVESESGWATPADYALDFAESLVTQLEYEQQKANGKRERFSEKAVAAPESVTDRENSSPSTKRENTDGYLALSLICTDGGTQSRAGLHEETITEYAQAMDAGAIFPPVLVFYDGFDYWLTDGFHRVAAAKRLEWADIAAEVRQGTRRDAILYSVGANANHGLRRTNADKRRAVETLLRDEEWSQWSNREIAKRCGVSPAFVDKLRLDTNSSANGRQIERTATRKGTTYTVDTANIGTKTKKTPKPDPTEHFKQEDNAPPPIPYQVGSVVEIRAGCNPTLRKHDGMWGIITHVGSFSCTVHISVKNVNVQCKPDEMDPVDPKYTQDIQAVSARIAALSKLDLDPAVWSILEILSLKTCFTQIQLDLLAFAEERYGIKTLN